MHRQRHVKYLVETYLSKTSASKLSEQSARMHAAAAEMAASGTTIRYLEALVVPDEEFCFFVFEAASAEEVAEASRRADIIYERIVRAL